MRRKPRNLKISFTDAAQTHFGGIYFLQEFIALLQLRHGLAKALRDDRLRTRYSVGQMVFALMYPTVLGLDRLEAASFLRSNGVFQYLTGLPQFPNPTTLRRFLYQAPPALCEQLRRFNDRLAATLLQCPHQRSRLLLDLDTTVLSVYGNHEAARVGYNPKRRGARSYEPLLCFEARSGLFWAGLQRPGGNAGADEVVPLLDRCWAMAPPSIREVRVRGDHAFYSQTTLAWLEAHGAEYAIVARLTRPLRHRLTGLRFQRLDDRWALADFEYQPEAWAQKRRFIAVRRRLRPEDPQPTLFTLGRYSYHAYVTNLPVSATRIWRFYNDRARIELSIKELKQDYALGEIPTRRFNANALYFEVLRLAHNLVVGFQTLCLPPRWADATLSTLRNHFFLLPAVLAKPQGRPALRFPKYLPAREDIDIVTKQLERLRRRPAW
jgi:hypothetical protein